MKSEIEQSFGTWLPLGGLAFHHQSCGLLERLEYCSNVSRLLLAGIVGSFIDHNQTQKGTPMSTEATANEAQPKHKSTDAETVRRVLSVREPAKKAVDEKPPAEPKTPER